jgi:hypothetical protein
MPSGFGDRLSPFTFSAHTDPVPDEDDRPRDASSAADPGWSDADQAAKAWSQAVAPDDIRELARDIQAYHRERRAARRRERLRRLFARPGSAPMTLTVAVLAIAALVAMLLTVMDPARSRPSSLPLTAPSAAPGQPGGLLPAVSLRDLSGNAIPSRSLRPGVIALIPLNCHCAPLLSALAGDASTKQLPLLVVAPTAPDADAAALGGRIDRGTSSVYYDASGLLANDFGAKGVTVVLLDRDGTVFRVRRDVATEASSHLIPLLQQMLPQQGTSG